MRTAFDLTPYRRSTVGFDRLFDFIEAAAQGAQVDNYPPFDVEKLDTDSYRITLAVAGFKQDEIEITSHQNQLAITGRKAEVNAGEGRRLIHAGIATRAFERRFQLADFVRVEKADLADGLLTVDLVREVPEAAKPRTISIGGSNVTTLDGQRQAA
jgi:molecular chaperone IbpA